MRIAWRESVYLTRNLALLSFILPSIGVIIAFVMAVVLSVDSTLVYNFVPIARQDAFRVAVLVPIRTMLISVAITLFLLYRSFHQLSRAIPGLQAVKGNVLEWLGEASRNRAVDAARLQAAATAAHDAGATMRRNASTGAASEHARSASEAALSPRAQGPPAADKATTALLVDLAEAAARHQRSTAIASELMRLGITIDHLVAEASAFRFFLVLKPGAVSVASVAAVMVTIVALVVRLVQYYRAQIPAASIQQ